jgi:tetratricopeptide (TPR) repeat protein
MSTWRSILRLVVRLLTVALVLSTIAGYLRAEELTADRPGIVRLLREGDYAKLEAKLTEFQASFEAGNGSEWDGDDHFEAFETSDLDLEGRLNEWVARFPQSYAAPMARALYLNHRASMLGEFLYPNEASNDAARQIALLRQAAIADLKQALTRNRKLSIAYAAWIEIAYDDDDRGTVERIFAEGIGQVPQSAAIQAAYLRTVNPCCNPVLRRSRDALGSFLRRIKDLQTRFAGNPDFDWMRGYDRYIMGFAFLKEEGWKEAVRYFDEAIGKRENWYYYMDRAHAHAGAGDHEAALRNFVRAAALNPTSARPWYELGTYRRDRCFNEAERFDEGREGCDLEGAARDLSRAVAIDPLNPRYLWRRLQIYNWLHRYAEARADVERALTFTQHHPWFHREYARLLADSDREKAVAEYRLAVSLAAEGEELQQMLAGYLSFVEDQQLCSALPMLLEYRDRCRSGPLCQKNGDQLLRSFQMQSSRPCGREQGPPPLKPLPMPDDVNPEQP